MFLKFLQVILPLCRVRGIPVITGTQLSTQGGAGGPAENRALWLHLLTYTTVEKVQLEYEELDNDLGQLAQAD